MINQVFSSCFHVLIYFYPYFVLVFRSIIKEETRQLFMWPVIRVGKKLFSTFYLGKGADKDIKVCMFQWFCSIVYSPV